MTLRFRRLRSEKSVALGQLHDDPLRAIPLRRRLLRSQFESKSTSNVLEERLMLTMRSALMALAPAATTSRAARSSSTVRPVAAAAAKSR